MGTEPRKGFNWGAFMFNWIWGIGNGVYITLLCLIPVLNFIWPLVCGFKGNEWALNSGTFETVEEFNAAQKTWNKAGLVMFFLTLAIILFYIVLASFMFVNLSSLV